MYLQLAENENSPTAFARKEATRSNQIPDNPYIFIPDFTGESDGFFVREDYFDFMPDAEYKALMVQLAPYQPQVQKYGMSERQFMSDRASRKKRREEKKLAKVDKKKAKNELIKARAEGRAKGDSPLKSITGAISNIFGKKDSGASPGELPPEEDDKDKEKDEKKWYQNPVVWILGGVAVVATVAVVAKKRRRTGMSRRRRRSRR